MAISSVTSAMNTALYSIDRTSQRVAEIAENVSYGIESETGESSPLIDSGIAELPLLKHQIAANVKVFETAESLFNTLLSQRRR
ncbi:hypothetical protein [Gimesia fumaroli]|jgi:hypothetical protein|uniref:Flagellar basal-body/hook protein C-terminal domain-containing protein n=1 Tax=Gimesia fumaroli TaxID=2527976 RepID=A0A518I7A0_9PLAN|nr:hypothetical protein [Gimesia fumaroli]QDV48939.1 hypothetical protein Enr17x_09540 [Gimesia fumaroli]